MRFVDCYRQIDGADRYVYECPRGSIAITECRDGTRELTRCLGAGAVLTPRDEREALALHETLQFQLQQDDDDDSWEVA